jgi:CubicO group peptidase (beta-lactamase class C family)
MRKPVTIHILQKVQLVKRLFCLFALTFSSGSLLAQNPNPSAALDATIQSQMNTERFPGAATIIVKDGKIVWIESYGFADVDNAISVEDTTVFLLASLSKVFTGTAAMQLNQSGVIDIDVDINNYLPFTIDIPGHTSDSITMRHLMTHSSSIEDNYTAMDTYYGYPDPTISLANCMQRYFSTSGSDYNASANFANFTPGSNYDYSNIATALSGYLTEVSSGTPFDTFCDLNIFEPLCMEKTAWHFADFNPGDVAIPYAFQGGNYVSYPHYGFADYPDGQLRSTVKDLSNFMIAYLNNGTLGSSSILNGASINEMWSSQIPSIDPTQGLNWYQEFFGSATLWGHNGGEDGASTDMYFDPVNNIGICVLTNGEGDAFTICEELYQYGLTLNSSTGISSDCQNVVGISIQENSDNKISIYPNPTDNFIIVNSTISERMGYSIYSISGKNIATGYVNNYNNNNKIDLVDLHSGIYFLKIKSEIFKVIKRE